MKKQIHPFRAWYLGNFIILHTNGTMMRSVQPYIYIWVKNKNTIIVEQQNNNKNTTQNDTFTSIGNDKKLKKTVASLTPIKTKTKPEQQQTYSKDTRVWRDITLWLGPLYYNVWDVDLFLNQYTPLKQAYQKKQSKILLRRL